MALNLRGMANCDLTAIAGVICKSVAPPHHRIEGSLTNPTAEAGGYSKKVASPLLVQGYPICTGMHYPTYACKNIQLYACRKTLLVAEPRSYM